jgi:hypothetical protein
LEDTLKLKYGPYSASRLQVAECGYAFHKIYVTKEVEGRSTAQSDRGNVIHEVFEKIAEAKHNDEPLEKEDIDNLIQKYLNSYPAAVQEMNMIQQQCYRFAESELPTKLDYTEFEGAMAMKLTDDFKAIPCDWDDPEAFARGKLDILTYSYDEEAGHIDELIVYDHKTQVNIDKSLTPQLKFYMWMIHKSYPDANKIQAMLHFTRYDKYEQGFVLLKDELEMLQEIEDDILARIRFAENRTNWEASTCTYCNYCDFLGSCPATKGTHDLKIPDKITTQEEALILLDKLAAIKPMERRIDRIIREFVERYDLDALDTGKVRYGYVPSERLDWSSLNKDLRLKEEVIEKLRELELDPTDYMGFNKDFSKALLFKRTKTLHESMVKLIPKTTVTSFRQIKK